MTYYGFESDIAEEKEEMNRKQRQYSTGYKEGYNKAINDFVDRVVFVLGSEDIDIYCKETVYEVAQQLKDHK